MSEGVTSSVETGEQKREQNDQNTDYVLDEFGGSFSRFQLYNYALLSLPFMMCGMVALSYVFTALNLEYR